MEQKPSYNEFDLVQRALQGEKAAWDALFLEILEPYINRMVGKALLPSHPDLFEEAVLESIYQIYANLGKFRGDAKITTWCYYYIMNAISKSWRVVQNQRRSDEISDHPALDRNPALFGNPEGDLEKRLLLKKVEEALGGLSDIYRRAIEWHVFDGLSAPEIAAQEGVSLNTVKSWLKRARKKLREHFERG